MPPISSAVVPSIFLRRAKIAHFIKAIYGGIKMTCPNCNGKTKVVDSRTDEDSTERRRECVECGYRFSTVEVDRDLFERMVKQNG
jgi:Zn ribbon nucleic-acid-binding protein